MSFGRRKWGFGLALVIFLSLVPVAAGGQARLLSSEPVDGASLTDVEGIVFEFDSLLRPDDAQIRVLRRDGTEINVVGVAVSETFLSARVEGQVPSGNYEISYVVEGSDRRVNEGSIRVSVESPEQSLSGGLLAVVGIAIAMSIFLGLVFRRDKLRRPAR